jgi:hypothetical protein
MKNTIRFEQASFIVNEADSLKILSERYYAIVLVFTKSTFLQFLAMDLWMKILDINEYWISKDYSKMLVDKTNEILKEFEELQNNKKFEEVKTLLIETIQRLNKENYLG